MTATFCGVATSSSTAVTVFGTVMVTVAVTHTGVGVDVSQTSYV